MSASAPDRRGDELPAELQRREERLAKIREAKAGARGGGARAEAARRAELEAQGKKPRAAARRARPVRAEAGRRSGTSPTRSRRS